MQIHYYVAYLLLMLFFGVVRPLNLLDLPPVRHTPLPHQAAAIKAIKDSKVSRAQLVLPGGSGKTLIGIHLAREALSAQGSVIFFVPTLTLLEQIVRSYFQDDPHLLDWKSQCLCVCSKLSFKDVEYTTEPAAIRSFINEGSPRLIFSTYQSANSIRDAKPVRPFDLAILDEAHVTAGAGGQTRLPLADEHIACKKRVLMTGTPRVFTKRRASAKQGSSEDDGDDVRSMDDADVFGDVVYQISYDEAVRQRITAPIELLAHRLPPEQTGMQVLNETEWRARLLVDACQRYGLKKVIAFSRTNERATNLQEALVRTGHFGDVLRVSGAMSALRREKTFKKLMRPLGEGESVVVCNAKVLTTGFDLKDCDGVFIADRMQSHVTILQAVARASRRSEGKEKGFVVIPVQVPGDVDGEQYGSLVEIITAMVEMDSDLLKECREWVTRRGEGEADVPIPRKLLERIVGEGVSVEELELETVVLDVVGA